MLSPNVLNPTVTVMVDFPGIDPMVIEVPIEDPNYENILRAIITAKVAQALMVAKPETFTDYLTAYSAVLSMGRKS